MRSGDEIWQIFTLHPWQIFTPHPWQIFTPHPCQIFTPHPLVDLYTSPPGRYLHLTPCQIKYLPPGRFLHLTPCQIKDLPGDEIFTPHPLVDLYTSPHGRSSHSNTNSTSLGSNQPCCSYCVHFHEHHCLWRDLYSFIQ